MSFQPLGIRQHLLWWISGGDKMQGPTPGSKSSLATSSGRDMASGEHHHDNYKCPLWFKPSRASDSRESVDVRWWFYCSRGGYGPCAYLWLASSSCLWSCVNWPHQNLSNTTQGFLPNSSCKNVRFIEESGYHRDTCSTKTNLNGVNEVLGCQGLQFGRNRQFHSFAFILPRIFSAVCMEK